MWKQSADLTLLYLSSMPFCWSTAFTSAAVGGPCSFWPFSMSSSRSSSVYSTASISHCACVQTPKPCRSTCMLGGNYYYYFASAAVTVDSSHITASSSASWSGFCPPSNFVNRHMSAVWFMVCRWPQTEEGDWMRPHLCKLARHGPWPVRKRFIRDHVWPGRSKLAAG